MMFKTSIWPIRRALMAGLVILVAGCSTVRYQLERGVRLERTGDYKAAVKAYTRAIEMEPGNALAFFDRACAGKKLGDLESATADFSRALELRPDFAAASMGRAHILFFQQDYEGAIRDFTRTIELVPDHEDAYIGRGIARGWTGDDDLAGADFDKAVVINPYSAPAFTGRANFEFKNGDFQRAIGDYARAIRLDPSSAIARYNSGIAREQTGDFRGAMTDYEKAADLSPEFEARAKRRSAVCAARLPLTATPSEPAAVRAVEAFADPFPEWEAASFEKGGMEREHLSPILAKAVQIRGLSSLIIVRRGQLLAEAYFDGQDRHHLRPIRSATKSIISLLVGIALREGIFRSLDQPLTDFIKSPPGSDPGTGRPLTLRELIDQGAGLDLIKKVEWVNLLDIASQDELQREASLLDGLDLNVDAGFIEENYLDFVTLNQYRLDKTLRNTVFASNTGVTDFLSVALARASGFSTAEFADLHLFKPLGIIKRRWGKSASGSAHGSAGLFLRPLDMAKLGHLVIRKGNLAGRPLVPSGWIEDSLKVRRKTAGKKFGYLWCLENWDSRSVALAMGLGGQGIICLPEHDIVIVTTGALGPQDTPQSLKDQTDAIFDFVRRDVVPPLLKAEKE